MYLSSDAVPRAAGFRSTTRLLESLADRVVPLEQMCDAIMEVAGG